LSVAPAPFLKLTDPPWPIEKVFQSMIPFKLDWLMVRIFQELEILPEPAVRVPPMGRVGAASVTG
jgi:hypothetical protein